MDSVEIEIVEKYIDDTYRLTLAGFDSYIMIDKTTDAKIGAPDMMNHVKKAFSLSNEEFDKVFGKWVETQSTILQSKV